MGKDGGRQKGRLARSERENNSLANPSLVINVCKDSAFGLIGYDGAKQAKAISLEGSFNNLTIDGVFGHLRYGFHLE